MIGRLVQAADFKRLLSVPPVFKSAHFAVHHLVEAPQRPSFARKSAVEQKLSTGHEPVCPQPVDEPSGNPHAGSPDQGFPRWLGCVVPKRHARRAVTRNLIKRQVYAAAQRAHAGLPGGMWLVRLRQPFAVTAFPSAASQPLREAVRTELDRLMHKAQAAGPAVRPASPSATAAATFTAASAVLSGVQS
jgi:ribonuclease P protein component